MECELDKEKDKVQEIEVTWLRDSIALLNEKLCEGALIEDSDSERTIKNKKRLYEIQVQSAVKSILNYGSECYRKKIEAPFELGIFLTLCITNHKNSEHPYSELLGLMLSDECYETEFYEQEGELRLFMLEFVHGFNRMQVLLKEQPKLIKVLINEEGRTEANIFEQDKMPKRLILKPCSKILEIEKKIENEKTLSAAELIQHAFYEGMMVCHFGSNMTYEEFREYYEKVKYVSLNTRKEKLMMARKQFKELKKLSVDENGDFILSAIENS